MGNQIERRDERLDAEKGDLQIVPFEGNASKYLDELVQLDAICLAEYGSTWTRENFLLDLPQKGQLSKLAISNNKLVGYRICSSYQNQKLCHDHRLAVHPDYRRLGIAQKLWRESAKECLKLGINGITTQTNNSNIAVNNLYRKLGFRPLKGMELRNYLSQKGKEEKIVRFTDDEEGWGAYFIEVEELLKKG
jgi:ribosomal-protein-alanine N-acetyltransferase